ncbi:unnamed protein product [Rhodiola kirilowii]
MKMNMRLAVQLVLVAAFASMALSNAATYTVGGASWSVPSSNGQYNTWASTINFTVGDVLVFNFATGAHDVATVTKLNYDNCEDDTPLALATQGPARITLTTSGMNYFICTISNHCEGGQKLAVNVTATTSGTSPTPSSTPSPTGSTTSPPPPGSSAPAVAGGSFLAAVVMGMMLVA